MKKILFTLFALIIVVAGYVFVKTITKSAIPTDWIIYSGNDITFTYPASFGANVRRAVTRPPKVTIVAKDKDALALGCPMLKDSAAITESWGGEAGGNSFSYYIWGDAGAGSLYTTSCYLFSWSAAHYVIDFEMRSHTGCGNGNCWAYCETEFEQECKEFDMQKEVNQVIEKIISTVKISK